jgi:hypothetical protein
MFDLNDKNGTRIRCWGGKHSSIPAPKQVVVAIDDPECGQVSFTFDNGDGLANFVSALSELGMRVFWQQDKQRQWRERTPKAKEDKPPSTNGDEEEDAGI